MMENIIKYKFKISIAVLIILHTVGVLGLMSPWRELVLSLTPANLLISTAILLWNSEQDWSFKYLLLLVSFFVIGFLVEVWGVNTGIIFGAYQYGPVLGWKIWNTPLMIGVNWLMLLVVSGAAVSRFNIPLMFKIILSTALMVALDFFIEPVAVKLNFWQWDAVDIPLQNYFGWFVTALLLQTLHFTVIQVKPNKIAPWLLLIQWLFFLLLA